jgi:gliding motility-associated-like protein
MLINDPAQFLPGFTITGNVIGTDASGTLNLGNQGFNFGVIRRGGGLVVLGDGPVTIGGAAGTGNIIAYNYDGFYTEGFAGKTVLENSFYCNSDRGIRLEFGANNNILPPAILCLQGSTLIGTAPPGQLIYLYRHDDSGCVGVPCQGKTYIDRIGADVTGMWSYDVSAWPGARFTAIAEDSNGNSSEFAECILDPNVMAMNIGPYCPEDTIFLFAELDTAVGNVDFLWFGPNGYTSSDQNPIDATVGGLYLVVANILGCGADSAYTDVVVYPESRDTISAICIGDSVIVNGVVYNEGNLLGIETIAGASPFGCDSVIFIDLEYRNAVRGRIFSTRPRACPGDTVAFWFDLQLANGPHDVIYTTGNGSQDTVFGIFDGHQEVVVVGSDVHFEILDIISTQTQCPPVIQASDSILVSDLMIAPIVTDYDGFGVSCFGANDGMISLNVSGAAGVVNYRWNLAALNGDIAMQLSAGAYAVTVTDAVGCRFEFDTVITQPARFETSLFIDPTTCAGVNDGALIIDAILGGRGTVEYSLNGSAFSPVGSLPLELGSLPAGPVQLTLRDSALCGQSFSLIVPLGETPGIDLGGDRSIFSGDSVLLNFESTLNPIGIQWGPLSVLSCSTCPSTFAFPPNDQYITLTLVDDEGCTATDSIMIFVFVPKQVFIPTVFSPNGDGINDRFYIQAGEFAVSVDYLLIADRWGDVVFERTGSPSIPVNDPNEGWDGTLGGKPMFPAVYTYLTRIRFTDNQVLPFSGTITLVR